MWTFKDPMCISGDLKRSPGNPIRSRGGPRMSHRNLTKFLGDSMKSPGCARRLLGRTVKSPRGPMIFLCDQRRSIGNTRWSHEDPEK